MSNYRTKPMLADCERWDGSAVQASRLGMDFVGGKWGVQFKMIGFIEAQVGDWVIDFPGETHLVMLNEEAFLERYEPC